LFAADDGLSCSNWLFTWLGCGVGGADFDFLDDDFDGKDFLDDFGGEEDGAADGADDFLEAFVGNGGGESGGGMVPGSGSVRLRCWCWVDDGNSCAAAAIVADDDDT